MPKKHRTAKCLYCNTVFNKRTKAIREYHLASDVQIAFKFCDRCLTTTRPTILSYHEAYEGYLKELKQLNIIHNQTYA